MSKYLESAAAGMHFSYYVHKPQGRPAYACAVEGEIGDGGRSFTTIFPGARSHIVALAGSNTAKNRVRAMTQLVSELEDRGWIVKGQQFDSEG